MSLAVSAHGHADKRPVAHRVRDAVYAAAAMTGLVGTGFHIFNIGKKPGGFTWQNLFYSAPIGAPAALILSGAMGFLSERVRDTTPGQAPDDRRRVGRPRRSRRRPASGLLGTVGEAGLLHFRGAYQNPFMYLPVTVPPIAAALIGNAAFGRHATPTAADAVLAAPHGASGFRWRRLPRLSASRATWAAGATGGRTC